MRCKKSGVIAKILNLELNNRDSRYASSVCILGVKKANPWVGLYNLCSKHKYYSLSSAFMTSNSNCTLTSRCKRISAWCLPKTLTVPPEILINFFSMS